MSTLTTCAQRHRRHTLGFLALLCVVSSSVSGNETSRPVVPSEQIPLTTPIWVESNGVPVHIAPWTAAYYHLRIQEQVYLDGEILRFINKVHAQVLGGTESNAPFPMIQIRVMKPVCIRSNQGDYYAYSDAGLPTIFTQPLVPMPAIGDIVQLSLAQDSFPFPGNAAEDGDRSYFPAVTSPTLEAYLAMTTNGLADINRREPLLKGVAAAGAGSSPPPHDMFAARNKGIDATRKSLPSDQATAQRAIRDLQYRQGDLQDRRARKQEILRSLENALQHSTSEDEREALTIAIDRLRAQIGITDVQSQGASNAMRQIEASLPAPEGGTAP